jgi:hypothetical protein
MVDLRLDADVNAAHASGVGAIVDSAERTRVSNFLGAVMASRSEASEERLEALVAAGQEAYENRTAELHLGWQKVILVETGLAGERLEHHDGQRSYDIMKWSYDHCKSHGYTIDDVDKGTPMGEYMFNLNLAIIANMPHPTLHPTSGAPGGTAPATGAGCLIAALGVVTAITATVGRSVGR